MAFFDKWNLGFSNFIVKKVFAPLSMVPARVPDKFWPLPYRDFRDFSWVIYPSVRTWNYCSNLKFVFRFEILFGFEITFGLWNYCSDLKFLFGLEWILHYTGSCGDGQRCFQSEKLVEGMINLFIHTMIDRQFCCFCWLIEACKFIDCFMLLKIC